nr:hypothetical protein [Nocardioides anomalus]
MAAPRIMHCDDQVDDEPSLRGRDRDQPPVHDGHAGRGDLEQLRVGQEYQCAGVTEHVAAADSEQLTRETGRRCARALHPRDECRRSDDRVEQIDRVHRRRQARLEHRDRSSRVLSHVELRLVLDDRLAADQHHPFGARARRVLRDVRQRSAGGHRDRTIRRQHVEEPHRVRVRLAHRPGRSHPHTSETVGTVVGRPEARTVALGRRSRAGRNRDRGLADRGQHRRSVASAYVDGHVPDHR